MWGFWPASPRLERGKAAYPPPPPTPDSSTDAADDESKPPVHIFIDNSNVFYGFLTFIRASFPSARLATTVLPSKGKGKREIRSLVLGGKKVRLDYATLFALLERGRKVEGRVLAGSSVLCQGLEGAVDWVRGYDTSRVIHNQTDSQLVPLRRVTRSRFCSACREMSFPHPLAQPLRRRCSICPRSTSRPVRPTRRPTPRLDPTRQRSKRDSFDSSSSTAVKRPRRSRSKA